MESFETVKGAPETVQTEIKLPERNCFPWNQSGLQEDRKHLSSRNPLDLRMFNEKFPCERLPFFLSKKSFKSTAMNPLQASTSIHIYSHAICEMHFSTSFAARVRLDRSLPCNRMMVAISESCNLQNEPECRR